LTQNIGSRISTVCLSNEEWPIDTRNHGALYPKHLSKMI
jgi:hypothetical protein